MAQRVVLGPLPLASPFGMHSPDSSECCYGESPTLPYFGAAPGSLIRRQNLSPSTPSYPSSPDGTGSMLCESLSLVMIKTEPQSPRLMTVGLGAVAPSSTASPPASPVESAAAGLPPAITKRPRGRPRKYPKPDPEENKSKSAPKARSKTGCRTCRRRKKKCDEKKPICASCEKNNVRCEGYPVKKFWMSGKQKTVYKAHNRYMESGIVNLPHLIQCVENPLDWVFFGHFNKSLCKVLTVNRDKNNPFQDLLLPLAQHHRGLMHSILSLAGFHLCIKNPDGQEWGHDQQREIEVRASFHFGKALNLLLNDDSFKRRKAGEDLSVEPPVAAQVVILCLKSICAGDHKGEFLAHLSGLHALLRKRVWMEGVEEFLFEFLIYHDISNSIVGTTQMPDIEFPPFLLEGSYTAAHSDGSTPFLSVCQGLYGITGKIRQLRERVRRRRDDGLKPHVDFEAIMDARAIDVELKNQECTYPPGSDEWLAWQVHRSSFWLFLHRTVNAPSPPAPFSPGSSPAGADPDAAPGNAATADAVREAVGYLAEISPGAPVQSVLLTPIFMVGCSAFDPAARPGVIAAFDVAERYSGLGNIKHARSIVHRMWELMDAGDVRSWDWEGVMAEMDLNLLIS